MKNIIKQILNFIRRCLEFMIQHGYPRETSIINVSDIYYKKEIEDCFDHFKNDFQNAVLLPGRERVRNHAIKIALENNFDGASYLEFGVWKGFSTNQFAEILQPMELSIYAFDSFEGLVEDWSGWGLEKGTFDLQGKIPELNNNVIPVKGIIQQSLPPFLAKQKDLKINFLHIDVDTYESSKFILTELKRFLVDGAIILFDELYNFPGWWHGEYRALIEEFDPSEYEYFIFGADSSQVAVRFIKS